MRKQKKITIILFLLSCFILLSSCDSDPEAEYEPGFTESAKAEAVPDFPAPDIIGAERKINDYMEQFRELCIYKGIRYQNGKSQGMIINTRQLPGEECRNGIITRYEDFEEKLFRYRVIYADGLKEMEGNYYFLDDFIYYTLSSDLAKKYESWPLSISGAGIDSFGPSIIEGIIAGGICYQYDRVHDRLLDKEITLTYSGWELEGLYENGLPAGAGLAAEYEDEEQAIKLYQELLAGKDMYEITATGRYPRGDSTAVYAFGDCNGDGITDLHIDGGSSYWIYTLRGGELFLMQDFEHDFIYPQITPLKDGSFVGSGRAGIDPADGEFRSSFRRIPTEDGSVFTDIEGRDGYSDFYFYFKLNEKGQIIRTDSHNFTVEFQKKSGNEGRLYTADSVECTKEEWEDAAAPYLDMLQDESLHLAWNLVFPKGEWECLDSADEWYGTVEAGDDSHEWKAYERILSGDFSLVENMEDRSRIHSRYQSSLDEDTGRSGWTYILKDLNGDGVQELFVRYYPGDGIYMTLDGFVHANYLETGCFSYHDGEVTWRNNELKEERLVPLKDGRILGLYYDNFVMYGMVGTFDYAFDFWPEGKIYERLTVVDRDDFYDMEWFETYIFSKYPMSSKEEGEYYFVRDFDREVYRKPQSISRQEWYLWRGMLDELIIPDCEWENASFFPPSRNIEGFYVG